MIIDIEKCAFYKFDKDILHLELIAENKAEFDKAFLALFCKNKRKKFAEFEAYQDANNNQALYFKIKNLDCILYQI